jgi:hypothetical protein
MAAAPSAVLQSVMVQAGPVAEGVDLGLEEAPVGVEEVKGNELLAVVIAKGARFERGGAEELPAI